MVKHFDIKIYGDVQAVGFRWAAKEEADKRNLRGLAQNLEDGTLSLQVEGEEEKIADFLYWCQHGPMFATVKEVKATESLMKNFQEFKIIGQ